MKVFIRILSILFPKMVVSFAYKQLTNPQVKKLRPHEIEVLDKSKKSTIAFKGFDIQTYYWQGGEKKVLLIHGWEGQAGNFSDLVERLLALNYSVYAFDAPSHGFSSKGKTSLFEFTELVEVLIRKYNVKLLVSHSFGGVATTYTLFKHQDIQIDRYLLLTTPDTFIERINDVAQKIGITEKVKQLLIQRLNEETGEQADELSVHKFVQTVHVKKALVIHDKNDKVISIRQSQNVVKHWENATLMEVEGTGHFRILRTQEVLNIGIQFLEN